MESFPLMLNRYSSQILLEAKNSNCIVLAAGEELWVYSLKGVVLANFKDHIMPISSICVVGCFYLKFRSPVPELVGSLALSFEFCFVGQFSCRHGVSRPLLTSVDVEERQRWWAHSGESVPLTGRLSHNVQVSVMPPSSTKDVPARSNHVFFLIPTLNLTPLMVNKIRAMCLENSQKVHYNNL